MSGVITRRATIGAVLAAGLIAATPAHAESTGGVTELLAKIEAHRRKREAWLTYRAEVFNPMEAGSYEAREAVLHERTTLTYTNLKGDPASFSTEPWMLKLAKRTVASPPDWCAPDYFAAAQEAVQLAAAREERLQAIDVRFNVAAIEEREGALSDADVEAMRLVLNHPSTTIAEVLAKLRFIIAEDAWELSPAQEGVTADLERIGGLA